MKKTKKKKEGKTYNLPVRRLNITPTKIYFIPPTLELSNRVTRHFYKYGDRFLRITFCDEKLEKIAGLCIASGADICQKIEKYLNEGVKIGEYHYKFLAFSSSQLRDVSFWAFAESEEIKCEQIYNFMGDFSKINVVGKFTARMGQCFSSTYPVIQIPKSDVIKIDDIKKPIKSNPKHYYNFSDGIGMISIDCANQVSKKMGLDYTPTAFQIRYAGAKGVVAISKNISRNKSLALRDSMIKFQSSSIDLEIATYSRPMLSFINRQIILILSNGGVPDRIFEKKQKEFVAEFDSSLKDNKAALDILKSQGPGYNVAIQALEAGYSVNEPIIAYTLIVLRVFVLRELRKKTKFLIKKSRLCLGTLDETRSLDYGQVFLKYSSDLTKPKQNTIVHKGKVIIAKNPCLHPGDVRVFEAVDCPKLAETHCDVIVFPQLGHRPHPNEMSGSDLDGDMYFVTWDSDFTDHFKPCQPMDYISEDPSVVKEKITTDHKKILHGIRKE